MEEIYVIIKNYESDKKTKKTCESLEKQTLIIPNILSYTNENLKIINGNKDFMKRKESIIFILESGVELDKNYIEQLFISQKYNQSDLVFTNFYGNEINKTNYDNLKSIHYKNFFNAFCVKNYLIKNKVEKYLDNIELLFNDNKEIKIEYINDMLYKNNNELNNTLNLKTGIKNHIEFPRNDTYDFDTFPKEMSILPKRITNKKKKILFVLPWLVTGGADKFNLDLISRIDKSQFDISIILTRNYIDSWKDLFYEHVSAIFDLSNFIERKDWAGFIDYYIKTNKVDLVFFSNSMYGYHLIPWLKAKNPTIPFVDYVHAEDWTWMDGGIPRLSNAICNFVDYTYTCTNHLSEEMMLKMDRENNNLKTAYIGVDHKYYDEELIDIKEYEDLDNLKNKKIILFVCRLVYLKRPFFAIQLIDYLSKKDPDYVLVIVGDGECLEQLKIEVKNRKIEDNVYFAGNKRDVRPYYKIAKVTIIPSLTEGLALVAYESLSMKTPVISADVGGQNELIDNTVGAIIKKYQDYKKDLYNYNYSENEIKAYANKIIEIINSKKYDEIRNNCRNKIVNYFNVDRLVKQISNDFLKTISKGSSIKKEYLNNMPLFERYLIIFNNTFYQSNPIEAYVSTKQKIINRLWNYKIYRLFIKVVKKILRR